MKYTVEIPEGKYCVGDRYGKHFRCPFYAANFHEESVCTLTWEEHDCITEKGETKKLASCPNKEG